MKCANRRPGERDLLYILIKSFLRYHADRRPPPTTRGRVGRAKEETSIRLIDKGRCGGGETGGEGGGEVSTLADRGDPKRNEGGRRGRVDERRSVTRPSPPTSAGLINLILLRIAATTLCLLDPTPVAGHVRLQSVNDRFEDRSFAERKPRNNHRGFTVIAPREMRNSFVRGGNVQLRKNWLIVVARDGAPLLSKESRK